MNELLPEGPKKGAGVTSEEMKKAQEDYYSYFGWENDGIPKAETLKKLDLEFAGAQMKPFRKSLGKTIIFF